MHKRLTYKHNVSTIWRLLGRGDSVIISQQSPAEMLPGVVGGGLCDGGGPAPAPASSSGALPSGTFGPSDFAPCGEQCDAVNTRDQQATGASLPPGRLHFCSSVGYRWEAPLVPWVWEFWRWNHVSIWESLEHAGLWQSAGRRTRA